MTILELPCLDREADLYFPPTSLALEDPNGLLAWGGELSAKRLLCAYKRGIFPWYSDQEPVLWWTPSPRCVLEPEQVYVSGRTRRRLRQSQYRITADTAFPAVVDGCAAPGPGRSTTWINDAMKSAYVALHEQGVAHSVEVWCDDDLVGGIYGLAIGHMFFGESMYSEQPDASKIALIQLCDQLHRWGFGLIDCQVGNDHLYRMGAVDIERESFEKRLARLIAKPRKDGTWQHTFAAGTDW